VHCPTCNAENRADAKFCGECGASFGTSCPVCAAANEAGRKFCYECGSPLAGDPIAVAAPITARPVEAAAERRLVSVLFADLVGFTTLSEARDSEEVRELLSRYFELARTLIARYGGTVEKFIGDAVMAVWGTPTATEDDAERAVRAALDLVFSVPDLDPALQARGGVLTGEAAVTIGAEGEGMVAGDLVNTASRIQSAAEPGAVLVGESTKRATEQAIAYDEAAVHELKGKAEPVALFRALRVVSGRAGALKSAGLEAPFVGRERELRLIKDLFHGSAQDRRAHLVSLTGIAGIGKSRLAWEFYKYFDGIVDTVWWHRGRCLAYGEGVAYWALADMVRMRCRISEEEQPASAREKLAATVHEHLLDPEERRFVEPRLAHLLALEERTGGDRQDLFAAWRLFFERLADSNPTVLAFEDMQWADTSLLDFVEYLLEWSRDHPLYVVTLARPELHERRPGWGAGQRNFTSLYLEPLSQQAMEELLDGLVPGLPGDLRGQILARAEGVPLYAVETVRMLLDRGLLAADGSVYRPTGEIETLEVPETLHALIAARLDGVSPEERRLLQDGAVLGKTFTARALTALSGLQEPDLEALLSSLVRKEVLGVQADPRSPEHGQYGFLQDLVRHVAYETLSKRDRKSRHLAAADYLRAAFTEEDEVAEVLASHYLAAVEAAPEAEDAAAVRAKAQEMLVRAGERSASLAAPEEAQRYFEEAAALSEDAAAKAGLTDRAAQMAWVADNPGEARALLESARAGYEEQSDPAAAAMVEARLAEIDFVEGHPPQAAARLAPALAALETGGSDADIAALAGQLGRFLIFTGEYEGAAPNLERALAIAEAANLPETLAEALNTKAVLMMRWHRPREALILVEGALAIALENDLHRAALRAYNNLAVSLAMSGRWRDENALVKRALELSRRVGNRQWESTFLARSVGTMFMLGEWDEAVERAAVVEELAATEFAQGMALRAAVIHGHRGEVERARELLTRHADIADSENPDMAASWVSLDAAILGMEGRSEEAFAAVHRALRAHDAVGGSPTWVLFWALESAAVAGDDDIRELLGRFETLSADRLVPSVRAMQARWRARLPEFDAETEFSKAEQLFDEIESPFHLAVVRLEHAEWLAAEGRADEAEQVFVEAQETFERLKARPWLERAARAAPTAPAPESVSTRA
jgi:class 3 adenylate cyclase/tetratricopeptide (TPR) repeat protein